MTSGARRQQLEVAAQHHRLLELDPFAETGEFGCGEIGCGEQGGRSQDRNDPKQCDQAERDGSGRLQLWPQILGSLM